jgi:hypothetical protein
VRHALFALKGEPGCPAALSAATRTLQPELLKPFGSDFMENKRPAEPMPLLVQKFAAAVAAHFGVKQTEIIKRTFADEAALAAMPVSDFVAKLVSAS